MTERIGVLGGTFDPPHLGHLILAGEARWQLGLDRVLLVPAAVPPHKPEGPSMGPELRAALVERALADRPGLELCRLELERPGASYSADTLAALAAAHPGAALWFILGADQLSTLERWHAPERVLALARLAVAPRSGDAGPGGAGAAPPSLAAGRIDHLDMPCIGISSSLVRRRLAAGQPVGALVPAGVEELLREAGLVPSLPRGERPR